MVMNLIMLVMVSNLNHAGDGGGDGDEELTLKAVGKLRRW